ncbi:MAG: 2-polyprenyl-3-methyl-5-hydroxy-6-metoxy-1, 4-benzoquinol methylase [Parcubacteria group bacterium GW2011_GWA2_51_10]|nr:MAG: 2-polyprenyl-3-methyl-5-hydroxy-6-metoxy-1, 4-benzoquinol methylase [Parcubacteria group bacterium GW2011_GWA2_51_10]
MRNKDLKKIYNKIFRKGETKHFTKNLEQQRSALPSDEREALKALSWKGKRVLDVGCGTGLFVFEVAKRGAKTVGVDYSSEAIVVAKKDHTSPNIEFRCENIFRSKTLKEKFDVVVSLGTLEHLDDPYVALLKFKSLLKPHGSIILTCPNWVNPRGLVLQTLEKLFDAPITLADIHYFSPKTFEAWAKKLGMKLSWHTFDVGRATGDRLIADFKKRIPNVLRDAKLPNKPERVAALLSWLENEALKYPWKGKHIGATGLYHFKK